VPRSLIPIIPALRLTPTKAVRCLFDFSHFHLSPVAASQPCRKPRPNRHLDPHLSRPRCDCVCTLLSSCFHLPATRLMLHFLTCNPYTSVHLHPQYARSRPILLWAGRGSPWEVFSPSSHPPAWYDRPSHASNRLLNVTVLLLEKDRTV
jgi:hypothetical protein